MKATQRLIYLANARVPTEKAHGYQMFKMCEAFTQQGLEVEFWHPQRKNTPEMEEIEDVFSYYGVNKPFQLRAVSCLDWPGLKVFSKRVWAFTHALSFAMSVLRDLRKIHVADGIIYTRDLWIALRISRWKNSGSLKNRALFEAHSFPEGFRRSWMPRLKHLDGVIVITRALKNKFMQTGVFADKILVSPDGVDIGLYRSLPAKEEARRQLGLPSKKSLCVYTGHFYPWKGAHELVRSAPMLPDVQVLLVGGTEADKRSIEQLIRELKVDNVKLAGFRPPVEAPLYLAAADVVVLPNSSRQRISREYTSPLKLFEYMAACRPIVASDLPSIREILQDGKNAVLVQPDDAKALAEGIKKVLEDGNLARSIAIQACQDANQYTWDNRCKNILRFINLKSV